MRYPDPVKKTALKTTPEILLIFRPFFKPATAKESQQRLNLEKLYCKKKQRFELNYCLSKKLW